MGLCCESVARGSRLLVGEVKSVAELLGVSRDALTKYPGQPWWRGHSVQSWQLVPHVHRKDCGPFYEANITAKFEQRAATRQPNCPPPGATARWLFLVQHYGLPTRLLDWTESPLLAAYFAVYDDDHIDDDHIKEDGALWALDPFSMNSVTIGYEDLAQPGHSQVNRLIGLAYTHGTAADEGVAAILTAEIDLRMLTQLSGLTIHGSPQPLEERPGLESVLMKYVLPATAKSEIRRELVSLGIRERSVFPDLEHLARDLARDAHAQI